jgi:hypothetical protein
MHTIEAVSSNMMRISSLARYFEQIGESGAEE